MFCGPRSAVGAPAPRFRLAARSVSSEHCDTIYAIADLLPREEDFNLKSQIRRAATSVSLSIAEGSRVNPMLNRLDFSDWRSDR